MNDLKNILAVVFFLYSANVTSNSNEVKNIVLDSITQNFLKREATITQEPNWQLTFNPNGGYQSTTLTRIGLNGKLETYCTSDINKAIRFLSGASLKSLGEGE